MKITAFRFTVMLAAIGFLPFIAKAQSVYSDQETLSNRLQQINRSHSNYTELTSLTKSPGGSDVWLLSIGTGDFKNKPAIAILGGVNGSHILGTEISVKFAEQFLAGENVDEVLETTTFYVFPNLNPDAAQQYFSGLKFERTGNATSTDDDRDGDFDEDGFEDLNNDGLITMMRVSDPTGKWMVSNEDDRVMVQADPGKGEKGMYKLFTEGLDNDDDGNFNEDGIGGVNINKNFTFDFPYFTPGSGDNMASQPETRALLDFLYEEARNTFAVITFGPANNLSAPVRFNRGGISKRVIDGWYEEDVTINKLVSDAYNEIIDLKGETIAGSQGDAFQWAYFHYGRFSFSTPAWWIPEVKDDEGKAKKFEHHEAQYLAWAESQGVDSFIEWTEIDHPDFPEKTVEVGGLKPYSAIPPYELVDSIALGHTEFILKLSEMKPAIVLENFQTESAGRNITRITVDVHNAGIIPTASQVGTRTDWVRDVMIDLDLSGNLEIVSGSKRAYESSIGGDDFVTYTWLVRGKGNFTIKAGAPQSGFSTIQESIK